MTEKAVRAAGGIVSRASRDGATEVVLVHRPAYDDWTFPKGKAAKGESDEECALREVREETGLCCSLGEPVSEITYVDNRGRLKTVRYFAMRPTGGAFEPHAEIDQARWVALEQAFEELTYDHDRKVLRDFTASRRRAS